MPVRRALVPVDGSEVSLKAARLASRFAARHHWEVILLHVVERPPTPSFAFPDGSKEQAVENLREYGHRILSQARTTFNDTGAAVETKLVEGSPAEMIVAEVETGHCGIIVLGSTGLGRGKLGSLLFGSVAEQVIRKVRVPILLVKEDTDID